MLSPQQIQTSAAQGKVAMGGRNINQKVDPDVAVANALLAFEDGLYLVMLDGVEHRELDAVVSVQEHSRVTFIRLVFLAGA